MMRRLRMPIAFISAISLVSFEMNERSISTVISAVTIMVMISSRYSTARSVSATIVQSRTKPAVSNTSFVSKISPILSILRLISA